MPFAIVAVNETGDEVTVTTRAPTGEDAAGNRSFFTLATYTSAGLITLSNLRGIGTHTTGVGDEVIFQWPNIASPDDTQELSINDSFSTRPLNDIDGNRLVETDLEYGALYHAILVIENGGMAYRILQPVKLRQVAIPRHCRRDDYGDAADDGRYR